MSAPGRQGGAAIIVAMMVIAFAAIAAAAMLERQDMALRRLETAREAGQVRWLLRGATQWARTILAQDARTGTVDHAGELWATGLPPTEVEAATLSGEIRDQQGLFNLNNLVRDGKASERDVATLRRLLQAIGVRAELADALADWMDADGEARTGGGAENSTYLRMQAPYRTANRPLTGFEELRLVRGFDEAALARLRPFATVLPGRAAVNVNFAAPQVLMALVEGLTLPEAQELARGRATRPVESREDFRARLPRRELRASDEDFDVRSQFFLVQGRARVGRASLQSQTLLQREGTGLPVVVWQRQS
jgi:general secretion pathway protein K